MEMCEVSFSCILSHCECVYLFIFIYCVFNLIEILSTCKNSLMIKVCKCIFFEVCEIKK